MTKQIVNSSLGAGDLGGKVNVESEGLPCGLACTSHYGEINFNDLPAKVWKLFFKRNSRVCCNVTSKND